MTALELISLITQVLFIGLFVVVLRNALRSPSRATLDTLLLFGSVTAILTIGRVADLIGMGDDRGVTVLVLIALNLAPFAMLRLVDDFSGTPRWVQVAGAAAFVALGALTIVGYPRMVQLVELATIGFFLAVGGYAAVAFADASRRTRGITRRRMTAVAVGAGLFIGAVVALFTGALFPRVQDTLSLVAQVLALGAAVAFFLGFAPPTWMRRAWREPDLRRFLERSVQLAGVADDRGAVLELQSAAAEAFGATGASIGLADAERGVLRYVNAAGEWEEHPEDQFIAGRAFTRGRRLVALDAMRDDPEQADRYLRAGATTVIAAPITSDDRRMGVLSVYAARAPIFVDDDLWLIELLADQAAVLIEARTLTAHAAELRVREDAALLKEEFLSSAAHDLRTPLTVVLGQAELLERRLQRNPAATVDPASIGRIVREARRLRDLVTELLDVQRLEQGRVVMELVPADVCQIVEAVRDRHAGAGMTIDVTRPDEPLVSAVDRPRLEQVIENLVDNAVKYASGQRAPEITIESAEGEVRIAVIDHGVGIPEPDRDRIFERFYRASNVRSVTDTGLGMGLYICRRVVEAHHGRIWHEPTPGGGSTFRVAIPLSDAASHTVQRDAPDTPEWNGAVGSEAVADA
ncbi:MAG TPA: ATP-binding protein [Candidatus Limnocylindria bacterium]|nr:ATP-binding protein [Candidatus Limnocylindria bacterium]